MDVAAFRNNFPEFANTTVYRTEQLEFWATIAEAMLDETIWKNLYTQAVQLYVAHEAVIFGQNQRTATAGGAPGTFGGVAQSKAVGGVNVTYDSVSTSEKNAGWWNLTVYGKQLYRLITIFGAGCVQL